LVRQGIADELIFVMAVAAVLLCRSALAPSLVDDDFTQSTEIVEVLDVVR
jgi:hypothetical protein